MNRIAIHHKHQDKELFTKDLQALVSLPAPVLCDGLETPLALVVIKTKTYAKHAHYGRSHRPIQTNRNVEVDAYAAIRNMHISAIEHAYQHTSKPLQALSPPPVPSEVEQIIGHDVNPTVIHHQRLVNTPLWPRLRFIPPPRFQRLFLHYVHHKESNLKD